MKNSEQQNNFIHYRFALAVVLSIAVMVLDVRSKLLADFRYYFESALYPVLVFAVSPNSVSNMMSSQFKSHSELLEENERLSTENFMQRADVLKLKDLEAENQALRKLLNSPIRSETQKLFAEVVDVDGDPYLHRVIVNRGTKENVSEGMPVITDVGLVGQVMNVNYSFSRVLLLTDSNCAIPVINERTSVRAITKGNGSYDEIIVNNVPRSADIKIGDLLLTSGIGGVYPKGYPVAEITYVGMSESQPFADIKAKPLVNLDKMKYVLVFGTSRGDYAEDDIEERAKKLSDNKTVLQQNKVKNLIESMTVKPVVKKTDEVKNVDQ